MSDPNLIFQSGVNLFLALKCHHQIKYAKLNLEIICLPPYEREIWHYKDYNFELIRQTINEFN